MRLYFSGGEHPGHRKRLFKYGVTAIELNFRNLIPRLPKTKPWLLSERIPDGVSVGVNFEPEDDDEVSFYAGWVNANSERLDYAVEPHGDFLVEGQRTTILETGLFDPLWTPEQGMRMMETLCNTFARVIVPQRAFDSTKPVSSRINRIAAKLGTQFHGLGIGKSELMVSTAFTSVSSGSWRSAQQYGETVVWDGRSLHRFPAADKVSSRARWAPHIVQSGVDIEAVEADDKEALLQLAVWSWLQLEAHLSQRRRGLDPEFVGNLGEGLEGQTPAPAPSEPVNSLEPTGTRARQVLPSMTVDRVAVTTPDGSERQATFVSSASVPVRQCDRCDLSTKGCPSATAGAPCAYDIPVEIRTKDQLRRVWGAMMEMQGQRVFLARFAEELDGTIDPVLSSEMDRFSRLSDGYMRAIDDRETVKFQAEVHAGSGVLSRLFGSRVGETAGALPGGTMPPQKVDALMEHYIDAEADEVEDAEVRR